MLRVSGASSQPVLRCTARIAQRRARRKMQRDVGAAAQMQAPIALQRRDVRIDVVAQAAPHHDADPLHHVVMRHVDGITVGREDAGSDSAAIDFLDGNHVRIELRRILPQQIEIARRTHMHIGRQRRVAGGALGQPVQVPGRDLQLGGERHRRQ